MRAAVGATARVQVAVACGWRSPDAPRDVDAPALANPVDLRAWLTALDDDGKRDLVGRLDTRSGLAVRVIALDDLPYATEVKLTRRIV